WLRHFIRRIFCIPRGTHQDNLSEDGGRFMVGKGLLKFASTPSILSTGVTAGPLEKRSAFLAGFDKIYDDERCGLDTNEQGHSKLMEDACMIALSKIDKIPSDADFLMAGDLVNQMTPSNFFATSVGIPYF